MSRLNKTECDMFKGCYLSTACMGIGNIVLKFVGSDSAWVDVAVASKFRWDGQEHQAMGDGTNPTTITALYPLLNLTVDQAHQDEFGTLEIIFENATRLKILSNSDGYESYVIYLPGAVGGVVSY